MAAGMGRRQGGGGVEGGQDGGEHEHLRGGWN